MNAHTPDALPELDDDRIARMEREVFARIGRERTTRSTRRRRWWVAGASAAAVVVVAAVIAPAVSAQFARNQAASYSADGVVIAPEVRAVPESAAGGLAAESLEGGAMDAATGASREIVSSGSATVVVDDVRAAAEAVAADAERRGGYVESQSVGASAPIEAVPYDSDAMTVMPYYGAGDGWVSERVPAAELTAAIDALKGVGEVTSSTVSSQDVTDQTIDLRARIAAAETSVARLTELMAQSQSTADLIAAESALQERQATLDADRQQLALLEGQIDLASLSVQLTPRTTPVTADPAGFGDGLAAGWNGLVATLNGIVIAIGFLLPWIAVLAVAAVIVWGVVRLVRRSRRRGERPDAAAPVSSTDDAA